MKVGDIVYCNDLKSFGYIKRIGKNNLDNNVVWVSRACEHCETYFYGEHERDIKLLMTLDEFVKNIDFIKFDLLHSDKTFDWEID